MYPQLSARAPADPGRGPQTGSAMYVGDDIVAVRRLEAHFSADSGLSMIPVMDSRFAAQLARGNPPDVILLERRGIETVELVWELRAHAATRAIPVVLLATEPDSAQGRGYLAAGVNVCSPDPIGTPAFHQAMPSWFALPSVDPAVAQPGS